MPLSGGWLENLTAGRGSRAGPTPGGAHCMLHPLAKPFKMRQLRI